LCSALLAAPAAFAQQNYPQNPIRYIVPFPASGIADVFARIIGGGLTEALGQPVVVENRAGAAGLPAAITAKLNAEILALMRTPEVQLRLLTEGARFTPMTPGQFAEFVAAETAK
jgi:tripartite-type tricarboxylate transporter receptor subunit TctC